MFVERVPSCMCCCRLLSQAADAQLPLLGGSAGRLCAPCCGSPNVLGVAGTGEQVQMLGTTLGDETRLGNVTARVSPSYFITQLKSM